MTEEMTTTNTAQAPIEAAAPGERAAASAEKNRELVAIEDSLAAQQRARDADADRQRAALAAQ